MGRWGGRLRGGLRTAIMEFAMTPVPPSSTCDHDSSGSPLPEPPEVDVVIEVPRGSFLKRGSTGGVDFVSPLPCPFNYGSVPSHIGLEGDLLDALVLGPRLSLGARVRVKAWGAVTLTDRGMSDDKLVCAARAPTASQRRSVLRFFGFYARCKGLLNLWRARPGRNACDGWCTAQAALARARPRDEGWRGPPVEF
jgi:inorganic pyrophosphatase